MKKVMQEIEKEVKIKCRHVVKPAKATWNGILPLSILDQIGSITHTGVILYLYNKPNQCFNKIIDTLKHSLSHILVPFYPLAGRLHWLNGGRFELECNAMGVELIEAESNQRVSDLIGDFSSYDDLVPFVAYNEKPLQKLPLFLAQVTSFRCGGVSVCVAFSHVVVDGKSLGEFLKEWAKLARGEPPSNVVSPYLNRRILHLKDEELIEKISHEQFRNEYMLSDFPTLIGHDNNMEQRKKATIGTILNLTRNQVDCLKREANYKYSRFEVIAAHIWRCTHKARKNKGDQTTVMCFPIDVRSRLDPPLPPRYFGNAIVDVVASIKGRELIEMPLSYACKRIRETINKVNNDYVWKLIKFLEQQKTLYKYQDRDDLGGSNGGDEGVFYGNPNLGVSSWLNIPIYGIDFGWGKEIYSGPPNQDFDADIMIIPQYNNEGSCMVALGLQVEHMDDFKKYFYDDIDEFPHLISRI